MVAGVYTPVVTFLTVTICQLLLRTHFYEFYKDKKDVYFLFYPLLTCKHYHPFMDIHKKKLLLQHCGTKVFDTFI